MANIKRRNKAKTYIFFEDGFDVTSIYFVYARNKKEAIVKFVKAEILDLEERRGEIYWPPSGPWKKKYKNYHEVFKDAYLKSSCRFLIKKLSSSPVSKCNVELIFQSEIPYNYHEKALSKYTEYRAEKDIESYRAGFCPECHRKFKKDKNGRNIIG